MFISILSRRILHTYKALFFPFNPSLSGFPSLLRYYQTISKGKEVEITKNLAFTLSAPGKWIFDRFLMRKLCPNYDREDGLDTVLEVPIPEEMFGSNKNGNKPWQNMKAWIKPHSEKSMSGGRNTEIQLLLGVVGAPLIPIPVRCDHQFMNRDITDQPIEASMAKYIVQQYIAAVGGEWALNSVESMYAMGKVKMAAAEFCAEERSLKKKILKVKNMRNGAGEVGGFVLWQKRPELWCLELMVSGCKISAGSDGKVAWRQTPWHHSHASRGPPRPLRRFLQGLDPKSTANLFSNSICVGEKAINGEDCFILKLEAQPSSLRARSTSNVEIVKHTIWGYFSQKTGLLVQLEDTHLLRIKASGIFWETTMESRIQDYRTIDGINIAHGGRTSVSLYRFGENSKTRYPRSRMEEIWAVEEVEFNVKGLCMDCFLPPSDLNQDNIGEEGYGSVVTDASSINNMKLPLKLRSSASSRISASKIVAIDMESSDDSSTDQDDDDSGDEY